MFFTGFFHFCDTLDISLCAAQRFSRPQSLTTSHLSHSHSLRVTGYFNQCLVEFKREIKDYLYILNKKEFHAKIDPFLWGRKSQGDFPICLEQHCNIWPCQQRLHPQSDFFLAVVFLAKAKKPTCHQFYQNRKRFADSIDHERMLSCQVWKRSKISIVVRFPKINKGFLWRPFLK